MKNRYTEIAVVFLMVTGGLIFASNGQNQTGDIIFDHQLHVDLECTDCHSQVSASTRSDDKLYPEMDFCGDCHEIEDFDNCSTCHRNADEPEALPNPSREIIFSHKRHYDLSINCLECHNAVENLKIPGKPLCMGCHDGNRADNKCSICHGDKIGLSDIHPLNWRNQHGSRAVQDGKFCSSCHQSESFCLDCHQGDNTNGRIHDLNYRYTHGLDAGGKETNCYTCHDSRAFCNDCHISENRMPLNHSMSNWFGEHGDAARNNVENCAACHDSSDPTCARVGCHSDTDGIRGTDPRFHSGIPGGSRSWHHDDGAVCFECHVNTRTAGEGFCGYCHGFGD